MGSKCKCGTDFLTEETLAAHLDAMKEHIGADKSRPTEMISFDDSEKKKGRLHGEA